MLQILIWGVCALIFGVGYCAMQLERIAAKERLKTTTGAAIFILMFGLAVVILALSLMQAQGISGLLK